MAVTVPGVDVRHAVPSQRTATMKQLRDLNRLKTQAGPVGSGCDMARQLVLEHDLFAVESEIRWLDHVEATLARHSRIPQGAGHPPRPRPRKPPSTKPTSSTRRETCDDNAGTWEGRR